MEEASDDEEAGSVNGVSVVKSDVHGVYREGEGIAGINGSASGPFGNRAGPRVLVVEDDALTRKVLSRLLAFMDFQVVTASHGKEALELLKTAKNGSGFDAILTDEQMPSMTGIDFKRALRSSRWSHIPVFLMSSEVTDRMKHDAEAVGVKEVLAKPIQRRHLSALQRNLQAQRHLAVHHPISRFADANREIVNGSHGGKVVKPTMKRAVSLESHHIKPSKKARVMEQLMQIAETQPEKEEGSDNNQEDSPVKPKPQRLTSLLQAKSLPEAYDIRCYSLPLVSKDFLKSPIGSAPKLQIQPLDITVGLFPGKIAGSKSQSAQNGKWAMKPADVKESIGKVAASLSQLHHSTSSSAFQTFNNLNVSGPLSKALQPQLCPPTFLPTPPKAVQAHQHRFSEAFQAAMKHHKHAEVCTANRKAAILRFRAKRQQRNFEKKVRYASRKRLADQRPRIKGQFVKAADLQKASAE